MSRQDWGLAEMIRLSGQAVSRPWVVMPPMEWPQAPTPMSVRTCPASGPLVLRARVFVSAWETSREVLPLLTSFRLCWKWGDGTMKPAAARPGANVEFAGLPPRPWV
jgi:hypothetical protein